MRSRRSRRADRPRVDQRGLSAAPACAVSAGGVALAVVAGATGAAPLLVPGLALALLGIVSILWVLAVAAGVQVSGHRIEATVIEGDRLRLAVDIGGRRLGGLGGVELDHPLLSEPLILGGSVPVRRPGSSRAPFTLILSARTRRRGRIELGAPWLRTTDPLRLARVHRAGRAGPGMSAEVLVLPRIETVRWLGAGRSALTVARVRTAAASVDIDGLRSYQPGTPASRIHWPALASGAGLLERVAVSETDATPLLVVDPRTPETDAGEELLDTVVRGAASLAVALARGGGVDVLLPGRSHPLRIDASLGTWSAVHAALALMEPHPLTAAAPPLPTQQRTVVIYAGTGLAAIPRATGRFSARTITLSPGRPEPGAVLTVAGCSGRISAPGGRSRLATPAMRGTGAWKPHGL